MWSLIVSVDEETFKDARVVPARRGAAVNALPCESPSNLIDDAGRRHNWDAIWEVVDSWGAEVGERPTRSRTYDGRV